MSIRVNYPGSSASASPLIVFLHGTTMDPSWGDIDALAFSVTQGWHSGFAFAILEWPYWDGSDSPGYPTSTITSGYSGAQYCNATADKAALLFGRANTTSLSMLCALEKIDCSKGVGVAGYSQGAAIGSMAAMLDDRVTAFFSIALNTVVRYRDDGGVEETACHRDATLTPSARRYLHGGDDKDWAGPYAGLPTTISGTSYNNLEVGKYQLAATSGVSCGKQLNCLQPDGSGYFIVPNVSHKNIYAYNFTGMAVGYNMAAYGPMMNGFAWLAARAITNKSGCPCPEGSRRKLLFGSMPKSTCCAAF
jgi:hypothetical protein